MHANLLTKASRIESLSIYLSGLRDAFALTFALTDFSREMNVMHKTLLTLMFVFVRMTSIPFTSFTVVLDAHGEKAKGQREKSAKRIAHVWSLYAIHILAIAK